jgi:hypothetical protein
MKDLEIIINDIIESNAEDKIDLLVSSSFENWLYFYIMEEGKHLKSNSDNVVVILSIDKENPVNIPFIKNKNESIGVLYASKEKAINSVEFKCKLGKMKGLKALQMFSELNDINIISIQGNKGYVLIKKETILKLIKNA